jgi:hypothetical protein
MPKIYKDPQSLSVLQKIWADVDDSQDVKVPFSM